MDNDKQCLMCDERVGVGKQKYCSSTCQRRANIPQQKEAQRRYNLKLREEVLNFLGNKCKRCGVSDIRVLQIDHINGNGYKEKMQNNYSGGNYHRYYRHILNVGGVGYQLLCANCNWIKRYEKHEQN